MDLGRKKGGSIQAGIDGLIFNNLGNAIFNFSEPVKADSPFEAEWEAFVYLGNSLAKSKWKHFSTTIYTDCSGIICKYLELSIKYQVQNSNDNLDFLRFPNIKVRSVPSEINCKADHLAKKGANLKNFNHFWVHGNKK